MHLVTGGCGFVGSNVAARLLAGGEPVVVCDNLSRAGSEANLAWLRSLGPVEFVRGDDRVANDIGSIIERHRTSAIFHLAGQVAMTTCMNDPRLDFETNTVGSVNRLEAVRRLVPGATVVYASSNQMYGNLATVPLREEASRYVAPIHPHGVDESTPLNFQTPYGCSKGAADQYMLDYERVYALNTVVFRHSTVYGGRQFSTFDQGWVGWFCQQALEQAADRNSRPFTIAGNGKQVRDLLYVDDAVDACFAAMTHIDTARGQAFNIGGGAGNSSSLLELFAQLKALTGVQLHFERQAWRHSDQRYFVADARKVERLIGWVPQMDKTSGVARMLDWTKVINAARA